MPQHHVHTTGYNYLLKKRLLMAVQKVKKLAPDVVRRSHDALTKPTLSTDSVTGEVHRRHHMSSEGYYRGRAIVDIAVDDDEE